MRDCDQKDQAARETARRLKGQNSGSSYCMMWQLALNAWSFKETVDAELLTNKIAAGRDKDQGDIAWLKENLGDDSSL